MANAPTNLQPPIRAAHMGLFPTMGSLQEVIDYAESKVPVASKNEMFALLMTYQNTLLQTLKSQAQVN